VYSLRFALPYRIGTNEPDAGAFASLPLSSSWSRGITWSRIMVSTRIPPLSAQIFWHRVIFLLPNMIA
jgi:hypothetical protein